MLSAAKSRTAGEKSKWYTTWCIPLWSPNQFRFQISDFRCQLKTALCSLLSACCRLSSVICFFAAFCLLGFGCASMRIQQTMEPDGYAYITAEEFADELDNGKGSFVLLDVRTPREYARGHLWGAVLIPSNEILTRYGELGCKCHEVVVYDSGKGQQSAFACKALVDLGFQRVKNLAGGIKAWRKAGQTLVK